MSRKEKPSPWTLEPGDLPPEWVVKRMPQLRGLEENAAFRYLTHQSKSGIGFFEFQRKNVFQQIKRIAPELWMSGVSGKELTLAWIGRGMSRNEIRKRFVVAGLYIGAMVLANLVFVLGVGGLRPNSGPHRAVIFPLVLFAWIPTFSLLYHAHFVWVGPRFIYMVAESQRDKYRKFMEAAARRIRNSVTLGLGSMAVMYAGVIPLVFAGRRFGGGAGILLCAAAFLAPALVLFIFARYSDKAEKSWLDRAVESTEKLYQEWARAESGD